MLLTAVNALRIPGFDAALTISSAKTGIVPSQIFSTKASLILL